MRPKGHVYTCTHVILMCACHVCMHMCAYTTVCAYLRVHATHTCPHVYVPCMYAYSVHGCMHTCAYVCVHMSMHVYMCEVHPSPGELGLKPTLGTNGP